MIIAIGHEDAETRRAPWITLSLIALCSVAWIATLYARASAEILPPEHYQAQAIVFWEDHPYLEIDEALAFLMLEKDRPELFAAAVQGAEQGGGTQRVLAGDFGERDWERWLKDKRPTGWVFSIPIGRSFRQMGPKKMTIAMWLPRLLLARPETIRSTIRMTWTGSE